MTHLKKQSIFIGFSLALGALSLMGCSSTTQQGGSSLASDEMPKSSCLNCKLEAFYVDGHWLEGRD